MLRTLLVALFLAVYVLAAGPVFIAHCLLTGSPELLYRVGLAGACWALRLAGVDPPAVACAIPQRVALLAKKEVFRIPLLARAFLLAQMIPVDRADRASALASVELAIKNLRSGVSYLIFPEGTRSPDGRMKPFKKGSFVMAIRAGVPIVPVSVSGAHHLMRKGSIAIRPGEVGVHFGAPISMQGFSVEERDKLVRLVEQAVAQHLPDEQQPAPR